MKTIKFLTREHNGGAVPSILIPSLNMRSYPENRTTEVINFIEQNEIIALDYTSDRFKKDKIYCTKIENVDCNGVISIKTYTGWSNVEHKFVNVCVTEYDAEQSMLVSSYDDGTDEITPLLCINQDLNLWKDIT